MNANNNIKVTFITSLFKRCLYTGVTNTSLLKEVRFVVSLPTADCSNRICILYCIFLTKELKLR